MSKQPWAIIRIAALALIIGVVGSTALRSADEDKKAIKEAQAAIFDVADTMRKDLPAARKKAAALAKKTDLENVMHAFKPRNKDGIGVGPTPGAITPDWIDRKVSALGKAPLPDARLKREGPALARMGEIAKAIGEITEHYPPPAKAGAVPVNWKKYTKDMKQAAQDLTDAARKGNARMIQRAANDLGATCAKCHSEFRD